MQDTLIEIEGLYKKFSRSLKRSMYYGTLDSIKTMFGFNVNEQLLRKGEFWALKNISFNLKRGETLGIIGINGSGKTTLLRLLTGIFPPDAGKIKIHGRIGSLIAVGAGFHPHMTGRENIYLNGIILGMTRKEIDSKFDEIVDFAEVRDFLESPVAAYSSGMKVRLGFSIAIHGNPDIMLIDEVLSVGDIGFKNKSLRKIHEYKKQANGVIFVSHELEQIRILCDRLLILNRGEVVYNGPTYEGCVLYEEKVREERIKVLRKEEDVKALKEATSSFKFRENAEGTVEFMDIGILNRDNSKTDVIGLDEPLNYFCDFKVHKPVNGLYFSVGILNEKYEPLIWVMSNDNNKVKFENIEPGTYRLIVQFPGHHLIPNIYIPNIAIRNDETGETYERVWTRSTFRVRSDTKLLSRAIIAVKENWYLYPQALTTNDDQVFDIIKPGDITIDCGANVGDVTAKMVEKGATVYAFEPNPFAFERLQKRFEGNKNVVCINKGVWDKKGTMPLYLHYKNDDDPIKWSVSASLLSFKQNVDKDNYVEVELVDLKEFIDSLEQDVQLMKLDVEGAEIEILNKLINTGTITKIKQVLVETHEKQMPELFEPTKQLREQIKTQKLQNINLNWV
jgi:lipopolysaccharide transport system ATP-binding protein